jgi:hypothetical protein
MRYSVCVSLVLGVGLAVLSGVASAQSDPPGRVGRLAYVQGTVSFHDARQDAWSPAALNRPITTGDSLWTDANGHDEIQIAGTRVRMDGNTQLDMLALDDSQTRLQLDRGRLDVTAFSLDNSQPYQIVTPRGAVTLEQKGDYYIHAGSAGDPTVLGVRAGAAQIQTPNGQVLAVRAGEMGEVIGNGNDLQFRTVPGAPPSMPAFWAERDRTITYAPQQYLSAGVTGYEDLAHYGAWTLDPEYGEVWYPYSVPVGWQPYSTGYWTYVAPWGWTWVDAQPWGFAPYHYGRWAFRGERWCWIPPRRSERPVYAPALVAFVGGSELGAVIGQQGRAPVGWFPLGPREPYVPPYVANRNYYRRINATDRVEQAVLEDRWQRAERREALRADERRETWMNRRFTTVVPAEDFAHSRPVQQAALKVPADKVAAVPVAPVAAPPAPNRSIVSTPQSAARMEEIARPTPVAQPQTAPGPRIVERTNGPNNRPGLPPLPPRTGAGPQSQGVHPPAPTPPPLPQANQVEPQRPATLPPQVLRHEMQRAEPQRPNGPQRPAETHAPNVQSPSPPAQPQRAAPPRELQHPTENRVTPPMPQPPRQAETPRVHPQVMPQHVTPPPQQVHAPPPPSPPPQMRAPTPPPAPHPSAPPQQAQAPHSGPQGGHADKKK